MKFADTPKRTTIRKANLLAIYERMFGADASKLKVPALKAVIAHLGRCECGCKQPLAGRVEWEHTIPNGLQIQEDDKPPPDIDWKAWRPDCHKSKTAKDKGDIARAKRRSGITGQVARRKKNGSQWSKGRKLQGRGFKSDWKPNIREDD